MWVEALDGGDYHAKEMQYHDQVYALEAPFTGDPVPSLQRRKGYRGSRGAMKPCRALRRTSEEPCEGHKHLQPGQSAGNDEKNIGAQL